MWCTSLVPGSGVRFLLLAGALLSILPSPGLTQQRYKLTYQPGSSAGEHLDLLEHQVDTQKRIEQIERFLTTFPDHASVDYLIEWLQGAALRRKDYRKTIAYGERLLARHPDDFDALWRCWKAAEALQDPQAIEVWHNRALDLAAQLMKMPQPREIDAASWAQSIETARALLLEREYGRFRKAIEEQSPRDKAAAMEAFLKDYPASSYSAQAITHLMHAYRALGDSVKTMALAERVLARDPGDVDALMYTTHLLMERRTNYPRVIAQSTRLIHLLQSRPKPETYTAAEWDKQKAHYLGSAYLFLGNAQVNQNNFTAADKALRSALPYVKGLERTEAAVLFYLGWSNYHLENYPEAAKFFRACLPHGGEYATQASQNLAVMRSERRITE